MNNSWTQRSCSMRVRNISIISNAVLVIKSTCRDAYLSQTKDWFSIRSSILITYSLDKHFFKYLKSTFSKLKRDKASLYLIIPYASQQSMDRYYLQVFSLEMRHMIVSVMLYRSHWTKISCLRLNNKVKNRYYKFKNNKMMIFPKKKSMKEVFRSNKCLKLMSS